jgi:glutamate synthase domain-containing protein 2
MLDFVEMLAAETGLPVGIKSAVGEMSFWQELASVMEREDRGVDFISVDGGEGGTGASPLIFTDAVSLPFRLGFSRVYGEFARRGVHEDVTFIGAGKLGLPDNAVVAFALGADMVNVAREAMLAVGCVQAQKCHTGECPTGVATQHPWLAHGLDPADKAERVTNYVKTLRRDLLKVSETCGVEHPGLIGPDSVEVLDNLSDGRLLDQLYGYEPGWGYPSSQDREEINRIMAATDEQEADTQGPPETGESGPRKDEAAADEDTD